FIILPVNFLLFHNEYGTLDRNVTVVQTCPLPILKQQILSKQFFSSRYCLKKKVFLEMLSLLLLHLDAYLCILKMLKNYKREVFQIGRASCRERLCKSVCGISCRVSKEHRESS